MRNNAPNTRTCSSFKSRSSSAFSATWDLTMSRAMSASCFAAAKSSLEFGYFVAHLRDRVLCFIQLVAQVRFRLFALCAPRPW